MRDRIGPVVYEVVSSERWFFRVRTVVLGSYVFWRDAYELVAILKTAKRGMNPSYKIRPKHNGQYVR